MSSALFGNTSRSTSKNLVEFKAGKMYMKGKMVHPDKRKGLVYVHQASSDGLTHFCWKDSTTGTIEEDLIVFPDDCEYKRVSQCTTGRVYVLRFKSNNRRIFFWMQEAKTDKDDEYCRKINEYLNHPPTHGSQRSSGSAPNTVIGSSDLSSLQSADLHNLIGNISQQQLMQFFGGGVAGSNLSSLLSPNSGSSGRSSSSSSSVGGGSSGSTVTPTATTTAPPSYLSTTTSTTSTANRQTSESASNSSSSANNSANATKEESPTASSDTESKPIKLTDLQNILSGISTPTQRVPVDLGSVMTAEALQPILTNEAFVSQLRPLLPPTGDSLPPVEQLRGTVTSPQFQQAVNLFTSALQSGQLGPLIQQFELGEDAVTAAAASDMEGFVKALEKNKDNEVSEKEEGKKTEKDADKDDDDSMAVD